MKKLFICLSLLTGIFVIFPFFAKADLITYNEFNSVGDISSAPFLWNYPDPLNVGSWMLFEGDNGPFLGNHTLFLEDARNTYTREGDIITMHHMRSFIVQEYGGTYNGKFWLYDAYNNGYRPNGDISWNINSPPFVASSGISFYPPPQLPDCNQFPEENITIPTDFSTDPRTINIKDEDGKDDFVLAIDDEFEGVPAYLNSRCDGHPLSDTDSDTGCYYQCTEYAARYLHHKFGTDLSAIIDFAVEPKKRDRKYLDRSTQGFSGLDFHPNYGSAPKVDKDFDSKIIPLVYQKNPLPGDIAMFAGHTAVVKCVGTKVTLIEQNYLTATSTTYKKNRKISTSDATFYRFQPTVGDSSNSSYTSIQNAYDSVSTNGQTIQAQALTFTESPVFSNNISIILQGGYDANFNSNTGMTVINGKLTISNGSVAVNRVCIQ